MFESDIVINDHVKECEAYRVRAALYTEKYVNENFEGKTDWEILSSSKSIPEIVRKSRSLKEKLKHLTKMKKVRN